MHGVDCSNFFVAKSSLLQKVSERSHTRAMQCRSKARCTSAHET